MGDKGKNDPNEIRGYAGLVERNANHFNAIKSYAEDKGADTSGFTGVLALLIPAVDSMTSLYTMLLDYGEEKMGKVAKAVNTNADNYEKREKANADKLDAVLTQLASVKEGK